MRKIYPLVISLTLGAASCLWAAPVASGVAGRKICEVHGEILRWGNVPVTYGLIKREPRYYEARDRLFPYSNQSVLGGDVVTKRPRRRLAKVRYCRRCRAAEARWQKENPDPMWLRDLTP